MQNTPPPTPGPVAVQPKSLKICGILNFAFAAYALFGLLGALAIFAVPQFSQSNPMMKILMANPGYLLQLKLTAFRGLVALVVLTASGIGLLKSKEWARKTAIGYAIFAIVTGLAIAYLNIVDTVPLTLKAMAETTVAGGAKSPFSDPAMAKGMGTFMYASSIAGAGFGLIYPIVLICLMMSAKVRVWCIAASSKPDRLIA